MEDKKLQRATVCKHTDHGILVEFSESLESSNKQWGLVRYEDVTLNLDSKPTESFIAEHIVKGEVLECTFKEAQDLPQIIDLEDLDTASEETEIKPSWVSTSVVLPGFLLEKIGGNFVSYSISR